MLLLVAAAGLALSCGPSTGTVGSVPPSPAAHRPRPAPVPGGNASAPWADSVLESLTLEEKVGQLIMARAYGQYISTESDEFDRLARLVRDLHVGGLAVYQGDVYAEAVLLNKLQRMAKVPLLAGADFERGIAMRVRKGTSFPGAMALGATRDTEYAYLAGRITGEEARAIGVHQNFAPVADINSNPDNPVINTRSFGEEKDLVADMVDAYVRGTGDANAIATAKHFPGHGETSTDSHLDLPVLTFGRERLDSVELVSFRRAIRGGVRAIMVGHLAVPAIDSGSTVPASLSASAVNGFLKTVMGFDGLVITDAMDMHGLLRGYSTAEAAVRAVQAGADILLTPADADVAVNAILDAVRSGTLSVERLDASVRKVLAAKQWLRLNEHREVNVDSVAAHVGTEAHWLLAQEIARRAVTVVKNENGILPIRQFDRKKIALLVVNDVDDNRTGIDRPGNPSPEEPAGAYLTQMLRRRYGNLEALAVSPSSNAMALDSIRSAVRRNDLLLLALYVKVRSGSGRMGLPENLAGFVTGLTASNIPSVVISFGNPYIVGDFPQAQALVCTYSDVEVMVAATAEALFGEIAVSGKLPVTIPGRFALGTGVTYAQTCLRRDDPLCAGFDPRRLQAVDDTIEQAIRDSAFPAAQLVIARDGMLVENREFGTYTYDRTSRRIGPATLFDLASLTKVIATTAAVMKLKEEKAFALDDPVSQYLPRFTGGNKNRVTIRELLLHRSGLPAFRKLYDVCRTPAETLDSIYATPLVSEPGDSTIYSDLGMVILGKLIEKLSGVSLASYVTSSFYEPLRMTNTLFNPPPAVRAICAPTEIDTVWRKRLIQGSVHDETAALLGGVSGNAGLFSTASDLAVFMQMIMNGGTYGGRRYLDESTVREFTTGTGGSGRRALGWDLKSETNSSAGHLFSPSSFGHTGFTGTSIWADPERKLFVVFLTNRVYPARANNALVHVRPKVHDAIVSAIIADGSPGKAAAANRARTVK